MATRSPKRLPAQKMRMIRTTLMDQMRLRPRRSHAVFLARALHERHERDGDESESDDAVHARARRGHADREHLRAVAEREERAVAARRRTGDRPDVEDPPDAPQGRAREAVEVLREEHRVRQRPGQQQERQRDRSRHRARVPKTRATAPAVKSGIDRRSIRHTQNCVDSRAGRARFTATATATRGRPMIQSSVRSWMAVSSAGRRRAAASPSAMNGTRPR